MEDSKKFGIVKLGETNFHIWQQRTELWLRREDLWQVVEDPLPDEPTQEMLKKDRQARATIGLLIEDRFLTDIKHEKTAWGVWNKIKMTHSHNSLGTRLLLYRKIFSTKYVIGTNIVDHITDILEAASKLEDAGYKIIDELICAALMGSLPQDYDVLITTIEGKNATDITVDYVREKIIEEHRKKENRRGGDNHNYTKALLTQSKPRSHKITKCFYCQKVGHIRRDCRLLNNTKAHRDYTPKNFEHQPEHTKFTGSSIRTKDKTINLNDSILDEPFAAVAMTTLTSTDQYDNKWVIDTGASSHMCRNINKLHNVQELQTPITIYTADGEEEEVKQEGNCILDTIDMEGKHQSIILKNVLFVPHLTEDLISVNKLDEDGHQLTFDKYCTTKYQGKEMILGNQRNNLYIYSEKNEDGYDSTHLCQHQWHSRLGHRNDQDIKHMEKEKLSQNMIIDKCSQQGTCSPCILSKMSNKPFKPIKHPRSTRVFETIHSDVCGPINPASMGGNQYILSLIDDYSNYTQIYIMKNKDQTEEYIKEYIEKHINIFNHRPGMLISDGGGEYSSKSLHQYLINKGIQHRFTLPHTPQENGKSERFNRTLLGSTRALIKQGKLPNYLWGEVASTATYLLNRVANKHQCKTPFEEWYGQKPALDHLKPIGTKCYYLDTTPHKQKLDDRSIEGILVGYGESRQFYRIWNLKEHKITQSRCVTFEGDQCPLKPQTSQNEEPLTPTAEHETITGPDDDVRDDDINPKRKSNRINKGLSPMVLTYNHLGEPTSGKQDWFLDKPRTDGQE